MSLAAEGIVVRVDRATLLRDASLEVRSGEVVALVGPNGAGKSTLVRVLAGDRAPDAGTVSMDGRPIRDWSLGERARRRAVVTSDEEPAFSWPVREVVLLGRTPFHQGDPTARDRSIAERALEDVDALHLADRSLHTLSSGERQRVALARALAQVWPATLDPARRVDAAVAGPGSDPATCWLLLDEPTANLDLRHRSLSLWLLRQRAALGAGVLVVLHDLNLAAAHADRIAVMDGGTVVEVGPPADVLRAALLERVFGVPMLVLPHPTRQHPLVVEAEPTARSAAPPP